MSRLIPALAVLVLASGCPREKAPDEGTSPVDAGPRVLNEREPNEAAGSALAIDRNSLVHANLAADPTKPDSDWYLFKGQVPRSVDISTTCPPTADIVLEIIDEVGNVLAAVNAAGEGGTERIPNLYVSGKRFLRVVGVRKGAGGAYTLSATYGELLPGSETEVNDRRVDATLVQLGQSVSGLISHPNDVDWYRFELPDDDTTPPLAEPPPTEPGDASAPSVADVLQPFDGGTVYDSGAVDNGPAMPPAPPPTTLRIDLSAVETVGLEAQILTEAEAVLFSTRAGENAPLTLRNVAVRRSDRVFYIQVRSTPLGSGKAAKRGFNASSSYTLTVAMEEAGASAEFEPNDEPGKATPLPANSYREGFVSPKGDVDYFRLETQGPSLAKLTLSGVENVDLVLSVVRATSGAADEVLLKANEGGAKEPEQLNSVACSTSCLVKVETGGRKVQGKWVKDDQNSDHAYRLSARVTSDDGQEEREPNHSVDLATSLVFGKPVRGTIYPKKDLDFYILDLSARHVKTPIIATLLGILKVDVGLYLHRIDQDGQLTLVQTSDGAKGEKPETIRFAADPGRYVLEVRDSKNREANFQDSYQLDLEEGFD
jgi:hypothetical protein